MKLVLVLALSALGSVAAIGRNIGSRGGDVEWGYGVHDGPRKWAKLGYDKCGGGSQSPIDLKVMTSVPTQYEDAINFMDYDQDIAGFFINNGHTGVFLPDDIFSNSLPSLASDVSELYGGNSYRFLQLHYHVGSTVGSTSKSICGSEHTVVGQCFPLEFHLVHWNAEKYDTVGECLEHSDCLAVLGFLYKEAGGESPLKPFLDALPLNYEDSNPVTVNLDQLFLGRLSRPDSFFRYNGSLTTPECNPVVSWVVFDEVLEISADELALIRTAKDKHGNPLVDNYRPPSSHKLNKNTVFHNN